MTTLTSYELKYEDMFTPKVTRKGGKDHINMTKQKVEANPKSQYIKSRSEHAKDILIAILITGVIAFIVGVHFANSQHASTDRAVKAAVSTVSAKK